MRSASQRPWAPMVSRILVAGVCVAAALLVVGSMQRAWIGANDFQWSGARMLLHGMDPYQVLFDQGRSAFAKTQYPNYAPLLYVLLLPLAMMSLAHAQAVWAVLNLAMLAAAAVLLARGVGLGGGKALVFVALFFVSEPVCIALETGQQTALVLFAAVLAMTLANDAGAGAALSIVLVKYSFAPVALVMLARRRWTALGVAAALEVLGLLAFCAITGSAVVGTVVAPLRAADMTQARGSADVLTLTRLLSGSEVLAFAVAACTGVLLAWYARRVLAGPDWVDALAAGALISLLVFPHLVYDNCLLLPVAAAALRRARWSRVAVLGTVAALWYDWLVGRPLISVYLLSGIVESLVLLSLALVVLVRSTGSRTSGETSPRRTTSVRAATS